MFSHYSTEDNLMSKHLSIKSWQEQKKKILPDAKWKQYLKVNLAGEQTEWSYESWDLESATILYNRGNCPGLPPSKAAWGRLPAMGSGRWVPRVWWSNGKKERSQSLTCRPVLALGLSLQRWGGISEGLEVWLDLRPMWECDSHVLRLRLWLC